MDNKQSQGKKNSAAVSAAETALKIPRWPALALAAVWMVLVLQNYFKTREFQTGLSLLLQVPWQWTLQTPWILLAQYFQTAALAAGFIFAAFHAGDALLQRMRFPLNSKAERVSLGAGMGLILFSLFITAMGFGQMLYPALLRVAYVLALILALVRHIKGHYGFPIKKIAAELSFWGFPEFLVAAVLAAFLAMNAVMAFVPEIFYDALVYHLAIPHYYLRHHGIQEMPFLVFSTYPQAIHMLWTWALAMQTNGEGIVKVLHNLSGFLSVIFLYSLGRAYFSRLAGLIAALLYYSTLYVCMNAWSCGIDVANNFFFLSAFGAILSWLRHRSASCWIVSAVFCGFSVAAKYTGIFGVAALGLVWSIDQIRSKPLKIKRLVARLAAFAGIVLLIASPWLIKNFYYIGNPVHPFFGPQLGSQNLNAHRFTRPNAFLTGDALNIINWSWKKYVTSPWWVSMNGRDSIRAPGPLFLLFLPLLLMVRRWPKEILYSFWIFFFSYHFWYLGDPAVRYLTTFSALSFALAYGSLKFSEAFGVWARYGLTAFLALIAMTNWGTLFEIVHAGYQPWKVLCGKESRDRFLGFERPGYPAPSYQAFQYINRHLAQERTKILLVGENKAYYLNRDFIHSTVEANVEPLIHWIGLSHSAEELLAILRRQGVTHILINYREAIRNHGHGEFRDWDERGQKLFDEFWRRHIRQLYFAEGAYVYEILYAGRPEGEPPPLNIMGALQSKGWNYGVLIKTLVEGRAWSEAIAEMERLAAYGNPVGKNLAYLYMQRNAPGDQERAMFWYGRP